MNYMSAIEDTSLQDSKAGLLNPILSLTIVGHKQHLAYMGSYTLSIGLITQGVSCLSASSLSRSMHRSWSKRMTA